MNPMVQRWFGALGAPAQPTSEATGACAGRGGVSAYSEPDPNTPDQPFSWAVTCGDGTRCDGGAERTTSCKKAGLHFNPSLYQPLEPAPSSGVQNPARVFLQKAWDALRGTLAYSSLSARAPGIEDARRAAVSARTYVATHGYPAAKLQEIDTILMNIAYLADIAANGVDPVPNYPQAIGNFIPHLTVALKQIGDARDKYFVTIDDTTPSDGGAGGGGTTPGTTLPPTGTFPPGTWHPGSLPYAQVPGFDGAGPGASAGGGGAMPGGGQGAGGGAGGAGGSTTDGSTTATAAKSRWPWVVGGVVAVAAVAGAVVALRSSRQS